jgi:hypothetical protein
MTFRLSLVALGLAGWLTASAVAADDVEVLARGPVHEAYAEPSEREPKPTPIVPKEPPKPIEELPPDQKPEGDNVQWMPGYWQWDDEKKDFLWVSGFWRNAPPGRAWVPGSWRQAGDGWQWTGGFWAAAQGQKAQVEYLPQPPAPLDESGPATPAPSENHIYVPGTWVYRDRYVWQPGYWTEFRPGWVWVAAHYRWTPAGFVFIDGYWDFPLADRGILFAPVFIPPAVFSAPTFVFTPTFVVQENCLFGALFCRRGFGAYYFGDFFAPTFASLGFTAWCGNVGVSIGLGFGRWHDPLFSYYRCGFRSDPFWGRGIFDLYAGRYRGDFIRPPHTLVQQNTVINNITKNTTINNVNINNVNMVSSLNNVARTGRRNLQPVSDPARRQFAQSAQTVRDTAARRATTEAQLAARPGAGTRTAAPRTATLDVSRPATVGPKSGTPKVDAATLAPPRPAPTRVAPAAPRGANGTGLPTAGLPTPKFDSSAGAGTVAPRNNTKPPIVPPSGTGLKPPIAGAGTRLPVEPKTAPRTTLPKVDGLPRTPTIPPKVDLPRTVPTAPKVNPNVTRPMAPQSFAQPSLKPPAPRPPVTVPKPPSLPTAPRNFAPPAPRRSTPPVAVPRASAAPRLGPAAQAPRPAARPAPPPKKR